MVTAISLAQIRLLSKYNVQIENMMWHKRMFSFYFVTFTVSFHLVSLSLYLTFLPSNGVI